MARKFSHAWDQQLGNLLLASLRGRYEPSNRSSTGSFEFFGHYGITARSKRRMQASLGFRSFAATEPTIQGYEAMHMIRKGQVRWRAKGDIAEQVRFLRYRFALSA
jgi:hypothetical protein